MGGNVLLLEDDPAIRELLELIFQDTGHAVRCCDSLDDLVRCARANPEVVAVVDFCGESHRVLSARDRAAIVRFAEAVPTILVTGREWARHCAATELGLLGIVGKPFDVLELSGLVSDWVVTLREDGAAPPTGSMTMTPRTRTERRPPRPRRSRSWPSSPMTS